MYIKKIVLLLILIININLVYGKIKSSPHKKRDFLIRLKLKNKSKPKLNLMFKKLKKLDFDPVHINFQKKTIQVLVNKAEIKELKKKFKIQSVVRRRLDYSKSNPLPKGYKNLKAVNKFMENINKKYPKKTQLLDITKEFNDGKKTFEKRSIFAMKISIPSANEKPNVLIVSNHHAREIVTPEIGLTLMKELMKKKNEKFLKRYNIYIIPVLNVDGYHHVFNKDIYWRKNKREVDLNRNYDFFFNKKCGGSNNKKSQGYKGSSPFSEIETQVIKKMSSVLNFEKVLDFHSRGRVVLFPIPYRFITVPKKIKKLQIKYSKQLAKKADYGYKQPSACGEHPGYEYRYTTSYSFLVETQIHFHPKKRECKKEVQRVLPLIFYFLNKKVPVHGKILDKDKKPINSKIFIENLKFQNGEYRRSSKENGGLFHLWIPKGEYHLLIKSDGYKDKKVILKLNERIKKEEVVILMDKV